MVDLRKRTRTGHIIGETYSCHYWHKTYRVLGGSKITRGGVRVIGIEDGRIRDHLTPVHYGNDHPVSEPCPVGACRRRIGGA